MIHTSIFVQYTHTRTMSGVTISEIFSSFFNTPVDELLADVRAQYAVTVILVLGIFYALYCIGDILTGLVKKILWVVVVCGLIAFVSTTMWRPQVLWGKKIGFVVNQMHEKIMDTIFGDDVTFTLYEWLTSFIEAANKIFTSETLSTGKQHFQTVMQNLTKQE